jgi:hypothetical protein
VSIGSVLRSLWDRVFGGATGPPHPRPSFVAQPSRYDWRTELDVALTPGVEATRAALREKFLPVNSSWVQGFRFFPSREDEKVGTLYVSFHSGAICAYDNVGADLYDEMFAAASKGRFVHAVLYRRPYRLIRAGSKRRRQ